MKYAQFSAETLQFQYIPKAYHIHMPCQYDNVTLPWPVSKCDILKMSTY